MITQWLPNFDRLSHPSLMIEGVKCCNSNWVSKSNTEKGKNPLVFEICLIIDLAWTVNNNWNSLIVGCLEITNSCFNRCNRMLIHNFVVENTDCARKR